MIRAEDKRGKVQAACMCVYACLVCKNGKAKGKLSEERKTTEQEIQQEWKLGKSLKLNPIEEDGKTNK